MTAPTWEQLVLPPFQRRSDTSREAALSMYGAPTAQCRRMVLEVIRSLGPITDERIALATGLNPSTAAPAPHRASRVRRRGRGGHDPQPVRAQGEKVGVHAPVVVVLDEGPA